MNEMIYIPHKIGCTENSIKKIIFVLVNTAAGIKICSKIDKKIINLWI